MEDTFILEKRKRTVRIDGRSFIMREMGAEAFRDYIKSIQEASEAVKAGLAAERDSTTMHDAIALASDGELLLLMDLLKEPVPGGEPADEAFCRGLSFSQRSAIFKLQNDLNDAGALLKNLTSLLG